MHGMNVRFSSVPAGPSGGTSGVFVLLPDVLRACIKRITRLFSPVRVEGVGWGICVEGGGGGVG